MDILLPPAHVLAAIGASLMRGDEIPQTSLLWVMAYGIVAFILGLFIVRYRPLAT